MSNEHKKARLRLILIVAAALGCSTSVMSGTLAAFGMQKAEAATSPPVA